MKLISFSLHLIPNDFYRLPLTFALRHWFSSTSKWKRIIMKFSFLLEFWTKPFQPFSSGLENYTILAWISECNTGGQYYRKDIQDWYLLFFIFNYLSRGRQLLFFFRSQNILIETQKAFGEISSSENELTMLLFVKTLNL